MGPGISIEAAHTPSIGEPVQGSRPCPGALTNPPSSCCGSTERAGHLQPRREFRVTFTPTALTKASALSPNHLSLDDNLRNHPFCLERKGPGGIPASQTAGRTWAEPASRPRKLRPLTKQGAQDSETRGATLALLPVEQERLASSGHHGAAKLSSGWPVRAHKGTTTGVAGQLITPASGPEGPGLHSGHPSSPGTRDRPGQQQTQPCAGTSKGYKPKRQCHKNLHIFPSAMKSETQEEEELRTTKLIFLLAHLSHSVYTPSIHTLQATVHTESSKH